MTKHHPRIYRIAFLTVVAMLLLATHSPGEPLKAGFSYQGFLRASGAPASGAFDLEFQIFDGKTVGVAVGQPVLRENVDVSEGLFSVELTFDNEILTGQALWIEVSVRESGGGGSFTVLSPRQKLHLFSLNGKDANFSEPLSGQVTKIVANTTIIGTDTLFSQELSAGDALLVEEEVFTVAEVTNDTQLEVSNPPDSSALDVVAYRDDTLLRVRAGDGRDQLKVDRSGVSIGEQGSVISRIEHGVIGDCDSAFSTGPGGTVTFERPFQGPPRILATPKVNTIGCTSIRINGFTETGFDWNTYVGGTLYACDCIFWMAIGT